MQRTITRTVTVNTTGGAVELNAGDGHAFYTERVQISNTGANVVNFYLTEEDFDADESFVDLAAMSGFFDGDMQVAGRFWARSNSGDTVITFVGYRHNNSSKII